MRLGAAKRDEADARPLCFAFLARLLERSGRVGLSLATAHGPTLAVASYDALWRLLVIALDRARSRPETAAARRLAARLEFCLGSPRPELLAELKTATIVGGGAAAVLSLLDRRDWATLPSTGDFQPAQLDRWSCSDSQLCEYASELGLVELARFLRAPAHVELLVRSLGRLLDFALEFAGDSLELDTSVRRSETRALKLSSPLDFGDGRTLWELALGGASAFDALMDRLNIRSGPVPAAGTVSGDDVCFTIYRPAVLVPDRWTMLLAFAHRGEQPVDSSNAPDPLVAVRRQAEAILGTDRSSYRELGQDALGPVRRETQMDFVLDVPGIAVDPPRASVRWTGDVQRVEFRLRAVHALVGHIARGKLRVMFGDILLAEVPVRLAVESASPVGDAAAVREASVPMYRRIFASYSHEDRAIVEQFKALAAAFGDRYLFDVEQLRAGERWSHAVQKLIFGADVFQLFWSWSALRSKFVRQEWEYALSLGRPNFVRPTYWQQPLPEADGLPPPALRALHFQHVDSVLATPTTAATALDGSHASSPPTLESPAATDSKEVSRSELAGIVSTLGCVLLAVLALQSARETPVKELAAVVVDVTPVAPRRTNEPERSAMAVREAPKPSGTLRPAEPMSARGGSSSLDDLLDNAIGYSDTGGVSGIIHGPSDKPSRDELLSVLRRMQPQLDACWTTAGNAGYAVATLTISGHTGRVTAVEVTGPSDDARACVARTLRKARFAKFKSESFQVKTPLRFLPKDKQQADKVPRTSGP